MSFLSSNRDEIGFTREPNVIAVVHETRVRRVHENIRCHLDRLLVDTVKSPRKPISRDNPRRLESKAKLSWRSILFATSSGQPPLPPAPNFRIDWLRKDGWCASLKGALEGIDL